MRATIEVCTISGFPSDDHMGFPLSPWHRTTYVPVPEFHGEPDTVLVIGGARGWPFAVPFGLGAFNRLAR